MIISINIIVSIMVPFVINNISSINIINIIIIIISMISVISIIMHNSIIVIIGYVYIYIYIYIYIHIYIYIYAYTCVRASCGRACSSSPRRRRAGSPRRGTS